MTIQDNGNMLYAPFLDKLAKEKKLTIGYKTKIENIEILISKEERELKDKKHKENLKKNREILKNMMKNR